MAKFLKILFTYIAIIAAVVGVVNLWFLPLDNRNPDYTQKFENVPDHIEICNLGSSHGLYGFNYEDLSKEYTCFNFSLTSQSLSYDARILDYYKDHLAENAVVFITLSYSSFFGIPETEYADFESKNMRYYDFLPAKYIKEYDIATAVLRKFPCLYAYDELPLVLVGHHTKDDSELPGWDTLADNIDLPANTTITVDNHLVKNKLDSEGNRIYNQEEIDALYDIIEICESVGATPVLVTPPFSLIYVFSIDLSKADFYDDFYNVINTVTSDTGLKHYDYARHESFFMDFKYFKDCDHLNKEGALLFTNILFEEIVAPLWQTP